MAFTSIPNEAIDRMTELSAGALRLYLFLAHCRNTKTGKCCPSVGVTAEAIGVHRRNIFKLRNELAAAGWARFDGDNATELLGSNSGKNTTNDVASIEDIPITEATGKNATTLTVPTGKNATKQWQKHPLKVAKMPVACKEELDERTRRIELDEDKARQKNAVPPAIAYVRHLTHRYPDKTLWPRIVKTLGEDFDQGRLTECYESWVSHGWNKMNLVWLFEWYVSGVPERNNGNGRNQVPHKETHNERAARETAELCASAFQAPSGADSPDSADTGEAWFAADFRRV